MKIFHNHGHDLMFFRIPMTGASYNRAKAICQSTSGSLLRVEHIKFINLIMIKSLKKDLVLRIDAKKGTYTYL